MKYKFHEEVPDIVLNSWNETDTRNFYKEINFIAKHLNINVNRIEISENHPVGEDVIFVDGHYAGYLDFEFYTFMDTGFDMYGIFTEWRV